jgi:hypothetical protein
VKTAKKATVTRADVEASRTPATSGSERHAAIEFLALSTAEQPVRCHGQAIALDIESVTGSVIPCTTIATAST